MCNHLSDLCNHQIIYDILQFWNTFIILNCWTLHKESTNTKSMLGLLKVVHNEIYKKNILTVKQNTLLLFSRIGISILVSYLLQCYLYLSMKIIFSSVWKFPQWKYNTKWLDGKSHLHNIPFFMFKRYLPVVIQLLMHWSYHSLTLRHQYQTQTYHHRERCVCWSSWRSCRQPSHRSTLEGKKIITSMKTLHSLVLNSAAAKRSPNGTYETVGQPRYYQILVRLATQEFICPIFPDDAMLDEWLSKYTKFFNVLCRTIQNLCGPPNVPTGWSAERPRIFR